LRSSCIVSPALMTSLAIACSATLAFAETELEDPTSYIDGATQCAETKSARQVARRGLLSSSPEAQSLASTNIDVTYYHLDLDIDLDLELIDGVVRIEGTVVGSSMSELTLDLGSPMTVSAVTLPDGSPLAFVHAGEALEVTLPTSVSPGGIVAVDVAYSGTPVVSGFGVFEFGSHDSGRYAWSLSEPYGAREWWPCKDHPSDKADAVRVTVTVPSQYRVGSQGTLVSETVNSGETTYDWLSDYPVSSYLISVAIGEYVRYQTTYTRPPALEALYGPLVLSLDDLVYDDSDNEHPSGWSGVPDVIEVFENWFGPYPFADEKYGHAEVTFGGGMEHQTMSSMGGSSVYLVAHELAHQWFGDEISPETWPHLWLNEGFATFGELVYWEERADAYPGVYEEILDRRYSSARNALGTLVLEDTTSVGSMFNYSKVYAKGSVVLNMLRYVVGDEDFRTILRDYAADPELQYDVASTDDFRRVAETVSGMDLSTFFDQWVMTGTGYPSYEMGRAWEAVGDDYNVTVTVRQTQTSSQSNVSVFEMPLVIAVATVAGEERFVVENNEASQSFEVTVSDEPVAVYIDPDAIILRDDTVTSSAPNSAAAPFAIQALSPNPTRSTLSIQFISPLKGDAAIEVLDATGRKVLERRVEGTAGGVNVERLNTSQLSPGVYFLRFVSQEGTATDRFVVVR